MLSKLEETSQKLAEARDTLGRLRVDKASIETSLAQTSPRKDRKRLEALCGDSARLESEIIVAETVHNIAARRHDEAVYEATVAALQLEGAKIVERTEAHRVRAAAEFQQLLTLVVSIIKTAMTAQKMAERAAWQYPLQVELVFASEKFRGKLMLPRRGGWDPEAPDIELLGDLSLDALNRLVGLALGAYGADRLEFIDKTRDELKRLGKDLAQIYSETAAQIVDLVREEWRVRRDILDFNRRAAAASTARLYADVVDNWRPTSRMGFDILLPSVSGGSAPLLAGGTDPTTLPGWDDRTERATP